jgi:stage II sporulation protein D
MEGDSLVGICPEGESWYLLKNGKSILARDHKGRWLNAGELSFLGTGENRYFGLKTVNPSLMQREYLEDFHVRIGMNGLLMLNRINIENYIPGVTETEAGPGCELEYYKVQAILCRTYTLKNMQRHEMEGFHLCDGVHCQAYKGRQLWNEDVVIGAEVTNGMVLTDSDSAVLNAAYHSNSGGETRGSAQIWLKEEPYFRPILDRFSLGQPNSGWEKVIAPGDWINYLAGKGILSEEMEDTSALELVMEHRQRYYSPFGDSMLLNDIRKDWELRSDFFNIIRSGDDFVMKGRGYGHGVGLSQEGAMHMARLGYHYTEILNYYYHDIRIIHFLTLEDAGIFERKVLHSQ